MFAFTDYLSESSSTWKAQVGEGTSVNWPTDNGNAIGAPKNAGVSAAIAQTKYSIGPLEISYILENPGQTSEYYGTVQNAAGNYILANISNINAALSAGASSGLPAGSASWTTVSIVDNIFTNTTATTVYPITTLTYVLVYEQQTSQLKVQLLSTSFHGWLTQAKHWEKG